VHANEATNKTMQKQNNSNIQTGRTMDSATKLKMLSLSLICASILQEWKVKELPRYSKGQILQTFFRKWEQKLHAKRKNRADEWLEGDAHLNKRLDGTGDGSVSCRVHQGKKRGEWSWEENSFDAGCIYRRGKERGRRNLGALVDACLFC
jgi:hypothetical protein